MQVRSNPYRVLLVDDSLRLSQTARALFDNGEVMPAGQGATYLKTVEAARAEKPDVIVVSLESDEAFAAIESVMADHPTPILVLHPEGVRLDPFRALSLGALDVAVLPKSGSAVFWHDIARKLLLLSQVKVIQHPKGRLKRKQQERRDKPFHLVGIASSLGGPKALSSLLRMIPRGFPAPIVICQHISDGFTAGLASWLAAETSLNVVQAQDDQWLIPGSVFVAPSGSHFTVTPEGKTQLVDAPPLLGFKPSCDMLLQSVARSFDRKAIGVVLTGMGRDGARGLKEIRDRGGRTIAQHESTCVVYGMPKEAVELGAAEAVLPLDEIGPAIIRWVQ